MLLYASGLIVQAALAGVPPEELLLVTQLFDPLKFSLSSTGGKSTFEEEKRLKLIPGQTELTDALAVTKGIGLTVTVIVFTVPIHKPSVDVGVIIYGTVPEA